MFKSTLLLAVLVGQAAAFFVAQQTTKAVGPLQSYYNRNYDPVGGMGYGGGYEGRSDMGMMRRNDYDRGMYGNSYNDYNRGGYDRGYGGMGGYGYGGMGGYGYGGASRSKFSDWLDGSSSYLPAGVAGDRNYVMNRPYESSRYSNYYSNNNNRYGYGGNSGYGYGGGSGYGGNDYGMMNSRSYSDNNRYSYPSQYGGGRNSYSSDRYSPINYSSSRYGSDYNTRNYDRDYNRSVNGGYNRSYRGNSYNNEYARTYRSANDSHRQDYPNYGMGRMEDQFGYKKWWDSN